MINRLSDQELRAIVSSAIHGNRDAITELLKYYTADMYFVSRLYLDNKETAKKSEQKALRTALQRLGESLNAPDITEWMVSIVRKEALRQLTPVRTSAAYSSYYDSSDEYPTREDAMAFDEDECRIRILKALDQITEPERAVVAMRFFDHMSIDEIAKSLMVSLDEARSLLVSGKAGLRNSGTAVSTLMALCERVNPDTYTTEAIVIDEPREVEELPAEAAAAKPVVAETPAAPVHEPEHSEQIVLPEPEETPTPQVADEHPIILEVPEPAPETPVIPEPEENELPEIAVAEPVAIPEPEPVIKEVQTAVEQPRVLEEPEEERKMPVRKKKKSHILLKSLIAILLGAAAGFGLYLYLVMNKPKPYQPQTKPQTTEKEETTDKQEEKPAETKTEETKTEETKPAETQPESQPAETQPADNGVIGTAEVIVDQLRIRAGSGTGFDELDVAEYGAVYDVYEVRTDAQYMWYRIGDDMWIADSEGEWVTFTPSN